MDRRSRSINSNETQMCSADPTETGSNRFESNAIDNSIQLVQIDAHLKSNHRLEFDHRIQLTRNAVKWPTAMERQTVPTTLDSHRNQRQVHLHFRFRFRFQFQFQFQFQLQLQFEFYRSQLKGRP